VGAELGATAGRKVAVEGVVVKREVDEEEEEEEEEEEIGEEVGDWVVMIRSCVEESVTDNNLLLLLLLLDLSTDLLSIGDDQRLPPPFLSLKPATTTAIDGDDGDDGFRLDDDDKGDDDKGVAFDGRDNRRFRSSFRGLMFVVGLGLSSGVE
jgi:hypothetical protein